VRLIFGPIGLVDVEEVRVLLEALADLVALALERLAVGAIDAEQVGDAGLDLGDEWIVHVEVAAVAGPDALVLVLVVERGRIVAGVDPLAQLPAFLRAEEILADVQLHRARRARRIAPQAGR
jgi:hypothetical protein